MGLRRAVWAALVVMAQLLQAVSAFAQGEHAQVLVLHSTRRDAQVSLVAENDLPRALDLGLSGNLDYYAEFIDAARFSDPAYKQGFLQFLRLKYRDLRFLLVIAMQDAAVELVAAERDTLFRGTPVVFLTNDHALRRLPDSTGVIHERNFAGTVAMVRQLQPDVRQLFVVTGAALADRAYEEELRRQLPSDSRLTFTFLSGLPTEALVGRLSRLPPRSAVYYLLVNEDGAGRRFHPLEYAGRVAAAANAPT
jgi:hypothetical protein